MNQESVNKWMKPMIERLAQSLNSPENKQWIQVFLIDPILSYIMEKFFAYFVIGAIIFGCMLLLIVIIFVMLLIRFKPATQITMIAPS
jgi:hypothetical protein